ncbi:synaptotagmin-like protein 2 isoform X2 [Megalops cyprinoides]|uniref:synaptotagmin-like protein 2 isoform X2 n=1 Tax=Megalops cyprinoides TaxID=118141 RepID=UPI001865455C|nr:synaptotagmin-like protein 2 isoform X2 [Megalops cyprinoides]
MKSNGEVPSDLDLSFLSAHEEGAIRQVLQRDEKLRKQETGRVRRLRLSLADPGQLKIMTGEWFDDLRSRRHGRRAVATDIVRSSIRRKKAPAPRSNPFSDGGETEFREEEIGGRGEPADAPGCQPAFPRSCLPAPVKEEEDTTEEIALDNNGFVNRSEKRNVVKEEVTPRPVAYLSTERTAPTGITDTPSVDVLEWTYPHYRVDKQIPRGEKSLNPFIPQSKESPPCSHCAAVETRASDQKTSLENRLAGSSPVEDSANELQSSSPQTPRTAPQSEPAEDSPVKYLEPSRELLFASDSREEEAVEDSKADTSRQTELGSRNAETDQNDPEATSGQNERSDTFWAETPERSKKSDGKPFCHVEVEQCETGNRGPDDHVFPEVSEAPPEWHYLDKPSETQTTQAAGADSQVESLPFNETHKLKGKSPALAGADAEAAQWLEHSSSEKPEGLGARGEPLESWSMEEGHSSAEGETGAQTVGERSFSAEIPNLPFDGTSAPGAVTAVPGTRSFPEMDSSPALEGVVEKGADEFGEAESSGGALSAGGVREQDQSEFPLDSPVGQAPISSDVGGGAVTTVRSMTQSQAGESHSTDTREEAESTYVKEQPLQEATREGVKHPIPTIVVIPTEPLAPEDPKVVSVPGCEHQAADLKASAPGGIPGPHSGSGSADLWEDEAVDSDGDDCSSVSSVGSDLQGRRGLTSSALSLSGLSSSTLSVYSDAGDFGNLSVQGAVEFSLRYSSAGELVITVAQCQDLAFANTRKQRTDPYVKTYLLPDKSRLSKRKTSIKKRTVNPVYGESLKVEIDLRTWDWGHEALNWYNLLPKNSDTQESAECHGWLTVALKYVPAGSAGGAGSGSGEIHVWLREARDLRRLKPQGVDSFVKCYMLPDTSRKSRQKTRVVKRSQHPVYNHAMVYDGFRPGEVREACCELSIWDHNTLSNQFLGGVRLSLGKDQSYGKKVDWMDSVNQEVELWEKMLSSPNTWVQEEVPLRSSMTPRK